MQAQQRAIVRWSAQIIPDAHQISVPTYFCPYSQVRNASSLPYPWMGIKRECRTSEIL